MNISLLWRLRTVNRAWREGVGMTLDCAALEKVRVDTPGFIRYLEDHCERRPSLRERVEGELESIKILLTEHLVDYSTQSESV